MQRPHTPVCGWAPETLLLQACTLRHLQYHLPATPAWLTSVDSDELAGWLAGQGQPAALGGGHSYSQAHSSVPSPQLPPAADCLLALAPSFTPARKQARQAHRLLALTHCWRPASLQRHTNSPARDYQLQTARLPTVGRHATGSGPKTGWGEALPWPPRVG
jgi:hypothetical protein